MSESSMENLKLEELKTKVHRALDEFSRHDNHLIEKGSSERSMTHMLGVHLLLQFQSLHVDCEYSRNGTEIKTINLPSVSVDQKDLEAKTVYPDIVIHKRGEHGPNILIIEAKKNGGNTTHDISKLKQYVAKKPNGLGYAFGLLLIIPSIVGNPWSLEWFREGEKYVSYEWAWNHNET